MKNKKTALILAFAMLVTSLYSCGNEKEIESSVNSEIAIAEESKPSDSSEKSEKTTDSESKKTESEKKTETTAKKTETKTTSVTSVKTTTQTKNQTAKASTTVKNNMSAETKANETPVQEENSAPEEQQNQAEPIVTEASNTPTVVTEAVQQTTVPTETPVQVETVPVEEETEPASTEIYINLSDSGIETSNPEAVTISGSSVTINIGGKYIVSGTLSDGQIIVNVPKTEKVNLHLNNANINCSTSAPLYVISVDSCVVHIDEGSDNYLSDSASNVLSGCIVSKDDITFKGLGYLTVTGNKKFGIKSSNDIKIKNGNITVSSVGAAIHGEDSVQMAGGNVIIPSCKDGLKASNITETDKGFVLIEGGYLDIQNATGNGIEAITGVTISGGTVGIHSTKQTIKCDVQSIADGCLTVY